MQDVKICVIGLGYVGLPLARLFSTRYKTIGFDMNQRRVDALMAGHDATLEVSDELLQSAIANGFVCTSRIEDIRDCNFYVVAVPTPVDKNNNPDLTPLYGASTTVGKVISRGDIVVYESTVYPGVTEEECIPVVEKVSGLKFNEDFFAGYSPERINPGDKVHTLANTVKIVSGCDAETLETVAKVYELVVKPGVHRAPSIKVAEAGKIIENTQRDVNIALMNELSIIFSRIGINTYDVLEAAGTKWNFLKFYPGLVGGHCIGVDPYYLVHKAKELKYHPQMINAGRFVNDSMGGYIAKKIVKKMIGMGKNILGARVLVMGVTFKEDVSDIRNSKVVDIVNELKDFGVDVDVTDPNADSEEVMHEYGFKLIEKPRANYDAVIVAVAHKEYMDLDEGYFRGLTYEHAVLGDIKGIYRGKIHLMKYWSL